MLIIEIAAGVVLGGVCLAALPFVIAFLIAIWKWLIQFLPFILAGAVLLAGILKYS